MAVSKQKINKFELDEAKILRRTVNLKKSNILISSKFKSPLIENKIVTLAMSKIELDENGRPIAKITANEIIKLLGKNNTSIYEQIKRAAEGMAGRQMLVEDKENNRFALINLIGSAYYDNGNLLVKFEPDIKHLIYDLKKNYTPLPLPIMMTFSSVHSLRLYELLKSKAYDPSKKVQDPSTIYEIIYGLAELKITIGIVDTNVESVRKMLQKNNPNFDEILAKAPVKNFSVWADFKKRVIDVAIKEINEISDIEVRYDLVKSGRGGKVDKIIFYVRRKSDQPVMAHDSVSSQQDIIESEIVREEKIQEDKMVSPELLLELIEEVQNIIDEPIKVKEVKALLKAANYDIEKIKKAYNIAKNQDDIKNLVGWMVSAVKNDYEETKIPKAKGMDYETNMMFQELYASMRNEYYGDIYDVKD